MVRDFFERASHILLLFYYLLLVVFLLLTLIRSEWRKLASFSYEVVVLCVKVNQIKSKILLDDMRSSLVDR